MLELTHPEYFALSANSCTKKKTEKNTLGEDYLILIEKSVYLSIFYLFQTNNL